MRRFLRNNSPFTSIIKKLLIILGFGMLLAEMAMANEGATSISHTDIVPRVINFAIFVGILVWLTMKYNLISLITNRQKGIKETFIQIDAELKEAKKVKERTIKNLADEKVRAKTMVEDSVVQGKDIVARYIDRAKADAAAMREQFEAQKSIDRQSAEHDAIRQVLARLRGDMLDISSDSYSSIILKKVEK